MMKLTPFPTWLDYSDLMRDGVGGYAKGPYVRMREKYKDRDIGIHRHEYLHVTQYYVVLMTWLLACGVGMHLIASPYWVLGFALMPVGLWLHPVLYSLIPAYRFASEVMAYREQAKWYADDRRLKFAGFISSSYGLNVTIDEAYEALCK